MKRVSLDYVKKLINIKDYKFVFNSKVINGFEIKRLSQNIAWNTKALQNATFVFYMCPEITDSGVKSLFTNFSIHKSSLKRFELDLSRCDNLTAEVIVNLAKKLKTGFLHLRELDLSFLIKRVNNESLLMLGASLAKMKSLAILKLNFSYCYGIDKNGLKQLCTILEENREQYKELMLNFTGCKDITYKDKAEFKTQFATIPKFSLL